MLSIISCRQLHVGYWFQIQLKHQVLASESSTSSTISGWGSSRYLFAETDSDEEVSETEDRRFVSLDFRGGVVGGEEALSSYKPGWALGVGYDGNGALGLGQPAELSRSVVVIRLAGLCLVEYHSFQ